MGWTGVNVSELYHKWNGKQHTYDRKEYVDRQMNCESDKYKWELVKSSMVGSTWYGAIRRTNKETLESVVYGEVVLTSIDGTEFCYKEMDETMGPFKYDCPVGILKLLSPTDSEYALEWRRTCYLKHDEKKLTKAFFERSKQDDVHHIEFTAKYNYTGYKVGDVMSLYWHTVIRPYSKDITYLTDGHYRWPTKLLDIKDCKLIDKMGNVIPYPVDQ